MGAGEELQGRDGDESENDEEEREKLFALEEVLTSVSVDDADDAGLMMAKAKLSAAANALAEAAFARAYAALLRVEPLRVAVGAGARTTVREEENKYFMKGFVSSFSRFSVGFDQKKKVAHFFPLSPFFLQPPQITQEQHAHASISRKDGITYSPPEGGDAQAGGGGSRLGALFAAAVAARPRLGGGFSSSSASSSSPFSVRLEWGERPCGFDWRWR